MALLDKFSRRQIIVISTLLVVVVALVFLFTGIIPGFVKKTPDPVTVNMVGFEDKRTFDPIIRAYQEGKPHVTVNYQQINFDNYEDQLVDRLAGGNSPDIFMFHNTWLPKHYDKIVPANEDHITVSQVDNIFPTVIRQDFAPDQVVWALPLYIDTLALYYNKDLFDKAGVTFPPANWLGFQDVVAQLPFPKAAIGGVAGNVHRAADILGLLMLQAGIPMTDSSFSRATFASRGVPALDFYLSFADPDNDYYAWNNNQAFSLDLFAEGRLPMMFHYRYQAPILKQRSPFLNFGIAPVPQLDSAGPDVVYANYYGLAVSGRSLEAQEAWDFVLFTTTNEDASKTYVEATGLPPALRSLIRDYSSDSDLGVFARQALIARSWPQIDNIVIENIFNQAIVSVLSGQFTSAQALREAESAISNLMRQR